MDIVERYAVPSEDCRRLSWDVKDEWELTRQREMGTIFQAPGKSVCKGWVIWVYERRGWGKKKTHIHTVHIRNIKLVISVFFLLFLLYQKDILQNILFSKSGPSMMLGSLLLLHCLTSSVLSFLPIASSF